MVNKTYKFVNNNPDVMITKSDKGGVPIVVKITKYKDDVKKVLKDLKYYIFFRSTFCKQFPR